MKRRDFRVISSSPRPFKNGKVIPISPSRQVTDPRELFVPSPGKGSVVLSTRVEPEITQQIEHIVQSGVTAFDSKNDYTRAAIYYFHEFVVAPLIRDKLLVKDIKYTAAKIRRAKMVSRLKDLDSFVNAYKDALRKLAKVGMEEEVAETWQDMKGTAKVSGEQFYRLVIKWAQSDPEMRGIRDIVKRQRGKG